MDRYGGFRVGDFVVAIHDYPDGNKNLKSGMTGEVVNLNGGHPPIGVRWDEYIEGHTCDGHCLTGFGWCVNPEDICLVENTVGDISPEEFLGVLG